MINKIAHEASAKLLLICSYDCWVNVSDLWLAHGLVLMPVPMSTPFRLISPKKLRHKHKHKHEKNKHVRFSCANAYALMCQWKPDLSNEDCDRDRNGKKRNRFRPHPHESVFFFKRRFFSPVWPTVHSCPVKTVTENASFQKSSPELRVLKTPAFLLHVYVWIPKISNTMMSYIKNISSKNISLNFIKHTS